MEELVAAGGPGGTYGVYHRPDDNVPPSREDTDVSFSTSGSSDVGDGDGEGEDEEVDRVATRRGVGGDATTGQDKAGSGRAGRRGEGGHDRVSRSVLARRRKAGGRRAKGASLQRVAGRSRASPLSERRRPSLRGVDRLKGYGSVSRCQGCDYALPALGGGAFGRRF